MIKLKIFSKKIKEGQSMKKIIAWPVLVAFGLTLGISSGYAGSKGEGNQSNPIILLAKSDKKELEEKIEKLEEKIENLKKEEKKIKKEIEERGKDLKELKEHKKKKS
jgi:peptidoglycan hydrolase CwlO-like protein